MILTERLKNYSIVLASGSPRRVELLKGMGVDFSIRKLDIDESYPKDLKGSEIAVFVSQKKSFAFPENEISDITIVITSDTIVWQNGCALEKPMDRTHAIEMLKSLSGAEHEVFTGVTLRSKTKTHSFFSRSNVRFRSLSLEEIEYYVDTCKPFDKAGSYGVQEWIGYVAIERIEGSWFNVMGLPTRMLYQELEAFIESN
ncbi:MAG: septum formation protein Maf [Bacteroidetes bacterium GWF2_43_63]|nr:MAG: septum formation protein Maf [Bacteroidetes bacterium GWE2_42_42]OFY55613.1 MAG: septum formation protein Maf [Bacteroidetes bacterium GWF2_43_63]HBG71633.1 septum formation protein Maf [Bacteroidales bacterium]HCB62166.1 septum formation protein Maf [Bacteroidales bacterium]HCY22394.1 septum formation protein Maf [Bacteroidales bacterium]